MATLLDTYQRTYANTLSNVERSSDLATKLTERSYQSAYDNLTNMQQAAFRNLKTADLGPEPNVISLDSAIQAFSPEIWKAAGNKVNKAGLESMIDIVNGMGLVQYATGNSTFVTGIEEEVNPQGDTVYRFDLGELESTDSGPNVRFRTLSPEDLDEKGDLVLSADQLGKIFEDYQYNVRQKVSPTFGLSTTYSYISDPAGLNPAVTTREIPPDQTDPNGTNYGGESGDPDLDNQAYTGSSKFTGDVFQYLEEIGLNPQARAKQILEGGADELIKLTDSEITALENEYGIPMQNADLTNRRDKLLEVRADKRAAINKLNDPDLNLSDKERQELEQTVKNSDRIEERIMGDADRFARGGVNPAISRAVSDDEKEILRIEKKLKSDNQLLRLRRELEKVQGRYENIEREGPLKEAQLRQIDKLTKKIEERENEIDPRLVAAASKDKVNQEIASIIENPTKFYAPVKKIAKLLEDSDYELSEYTKSRLDEYINANLVTNTKTGGGSLKLHPETELDENGNFASSPGLGKNAAKARTEIDNRVFTILTALEAQKKLDGKQILDLMEVARYTGTLDTGMYQAMLNEKATLSRAEIDRLNNIQTDFMDLAKKEEKGAFALIRKMDQYSIDREEEGLGLLFTDYNEIYSNPVVYDILSSADPATGELNPRFKPLGHILHQLNVKFLGLISKLANSPTWAEWFGSGGQPGEDSAFDPLNPTQIRIKANYARGQTPKYKDLFDRRGVRKLGQPPVESFQLETLSGEPVGGTITRQDLEQALRELKEAGVAPGTDPRTLMSKFEQQSFLY